MAALACSPLTSCRAPNKARMERWCKYKQRVRPLEGGENRNTHHWLLSSVSPWPLLAATLAAAWCGCRATVSPSLSTTPSPTSSPGTAELQSKCQMWMVKSFFFWWEMPGKLVPCHAINRLNIWIPSPCPGLRWCGCWTWRTAASPPTPSTSCSRWLCPQPQHGAETVENKNSHLYNVFNNTNISQCSQNSSELKNWLLKSVEFCKNSVTKA